MKKTLTTYDIADALLSDDNASWSRSGALALAEYFEEYEESTGEELDLDVVAIRCDYSEHESLIDWAEGYFADDAQMVSELKVPDLSSEVLRAQKLEDLGSFGDAAQVRGYIEEDLDLAPRIRDYIADHGQLIEFQDGVIVSAF